MTGQKRCCATCRFIEDMDMSGSGWCTHPKRKLQSDVRILVRKGELACRNSWGEHFWADASAPAEDDVDNDSLVASAPNQKPSRRPDQERLSAASNDALLTEPVEDNRVNEVAHLEQADRAEVLRQSPRDAINRAWERANQRKQDQKRTDPDIDAVQEPIDAANQLVETSADLAPAPESPEPLQNSLKPAVSIPDLPNEPADRLVQPFVPIEEIAARSFGDSEDKFYEIPEIQPDVELPKLRNQFKLPRSRNGSNPTSSNSNDSSDTEMSSYDRVLQRAQEFKTIRNAPSDRDDQAQDRVTSTFVQRSQPVVRVPSDELVDEVVRFQPERINRFQRQAEPDHDIDDVNEAELDDDYELDRTYRPAESAQQSGTRWWLSIARAKVFRTTSSEEIIETASTAPFQVIQTSVDESEESEEDQVVSPAPRTPLTINWDDTMLASAAFTLGRSDEQVEPATAWASLDYLDEREAESAPMPSRLDTKPKPDNVAAESRFVKNSRPRSHVDPTSQEGMDQLRSRLFGDHVTVPVARPEHTSSFPPQERTRPVNAPVEPRAESRTRAVTRPPVAEVEPERTLPRVATVTDEDYDSKLNPDFDLRRIVSAEIEPPLDMTIQLSPEIPRKCATCRSFWPSGKGSQGWCTNVWAFPHRPSVDTEDLACESTIGCWWLPEDLIWDPADFLQELAVPTPRVDVLIAQLYGTREVKSS